jgi:outer membrane protein insertion porin family
MRMFRILKTGAYRSLLCLALALPVVSGATLIIGLPDAVAQSGAIRDIRVAGNRRVEPETVRSYLKFAPGDSFDAGKVDQSIRSLFSTGLFSDVRIDRDGAAVVVTVVENPIVNQVAFEGNSEIDKTALEAEVQIKSRSIYTRAKVQADVQRILDVYRRQGRFAASVEPKLIDLDNNRVNLVFEINEGQATKIKSIQFVGNRAFTDSQLRDIITTTQSGLFDFLKGTNIYDPDRVSLDKELLRQYYLKNGYADARVVSAGAELDRDGSGFFVTFVVDEGELYNFGAINIETSLPGLDTKTLRKDITTDAGAIYDLSKIDKTVERLTLVVAEQGFAFSRVRPRTEKQPGTRDISVTYVIDEGPRVYIERINVSGNLRTLDYVIRREFRLVEGDAYNPALVEQGKKRLTNLGFFKAVEVKRRPGTANDRVLLDVEITEQSTGELSFGAGFSTSEGVIGDVSITERNLLGKGQFLRLSVAGSKERFQIDLSFTEPRFLDKNIAAGFDLFHKQASVTTNSIVAYNSKKTGGSLRLGVPLSENLWLNSNYTLSYDQITDINPTASFAIKQAGGGALTSSVGTALTYDTRNHPKTPNRGYLLSAGVDIAGAGGDVKYARVGAEGRYYYPIADKVTFVARAIGGHIEGLGGQNVRLIDLYYKGGETVRGFNRGGYGPRDSLTSDALGGQTYWAATTEVRFPIPYVPEELGVSAAVFADAGALFNAGKAVAQYNTQCGVGGTSTAGVCLLDDNSVRTSAGGSILWNSPLGPLRLDIAQALSKKDYDKLQIVRFGASTKF